MLCRDEYDQKVSTKILTLVKNFSHAINLRKTRKQIFLENWKTYDDHICMTDTMEIGETARSFEECEQKCKTGMGVLKL